MVFSPEQMPTTEPSEETERQASLKERVREAEKLYGYIRPRSIISWPLSPLRREVLRILQTNERNAETLDLLKSQSKIELQLGAMVDQAIKSSLTADRHTEQIDAEREKLLRLLASKNPVFASPETRVMMERVKTIEDIVHQLKKDFGDKFVGLSVFGSMAKGYMCEESDLDYTIITSDDKVPEKFKMLLEKNKIRACAVARDYLKVYVEQQKQLAKLSPLRFFKFLIHEQEKHEHMFHLRGSFLISTLASLFSGLFFGDRDAALKLQLLLLEKLGPSEWDEVRMKILDVISTLYKAKKRFNLTTSELEKVQAASCLLRVPPPYKEALQFVRSEVKKREKGGVA